MTKIKGVDKVTFSSKEEQKKQLIETMGSSFETATGDANPLSDVYIVQTKSPDDVSRVAKEAKAIQGVDNANFGGSDTEILMATMKRVQFWGIIATALLTIVAVLLISNTIRITIMSRATLLDGGSLDWSTWCHHSFCPYLCFVSHGLLNLKP